MNAPGTPTCKTRQLQAEWKQITKTYEDVLALEALESECLLGLVFLDWDFEGKYRADLGLGGTEEGSGEVMCGLGSTSEQGGHVGKREYMREGMRVVERKRTRPRSSRRSAYMRPLN